MATVAEAVADALAIEADGPIFGLMGDANMAVWDCLCRDTRTRMIAARHDAAAVLMADGYARATGRLGVCTVTCGPGLANCATALLTAARAHTPLVLFTGEYLPVGKGNVQAFDQKHFAAVCEAGFRTLSAMDSLAEDIREGFYAARTRQMPFIINLPAEFWEAELPWDWEYRPSREFITGTAPAPQPEAVEQLAARLAVAERPVFIAGRGATQPGVRAGIERLGELSGALLASTLIAKGYFDGHEWDIGISGSFSSAPTEALMADADFVLGIGASLNLFTTEGGMLFPSAEVARIDIRPQPVEIGMLPGLYVQGDAKKTVSALITALERRGHRKQGYRTTAARSILAMQPARPERAADGLDPRELMRVLARALPLNTQVVVGAGHFWSWPAFHLALPPGGRYQHTVSFGSIGLGLAHGMGAALGNPDRTTLVIEGDGGLLQSIQELHAAAEQNVPLILLVMNDSGYGAEVHKMRIKGRDPRDATWRSPDFVAIARGFGGDGVRLDRESDLTGAIAKGLEAKGPFLIDARISPTMLNDAYTRLYRAQPNSVPLLRPVGRGPGHDAV